MSGIAVFDLRTQRLLWASGNWPKDSWVLLLGHAAEANRKPEADGKVYLPWDGDERSDHETCTPSPRCTDSGWSL